MNLRNRLRVLAARYLQATTPPQRVPTSEEIALRNRLIEAEARGDQERSKYVEWVHELAEARAMAGTGPWLMDGARTQLDKPVAMRESAQLPIGTGATGDIELALNNIEWRREINLSMLEFSRWGIQQLILISRMYYLKNPICRRLVDVCAGYVFARGVEVSSDDETANQVLKDFLDRNRRVLGPVALQKAEKSKDTDGNIFWVLFADKLNSGQVSIRTIDPTEIMDIVSDPDDADTPWFYHRIWVQRVFDSASGETRPEKMEKWYPALNHEPTERPTTINEAEILWGSPVYHRHCGEVAKWHFGCPRIYPMLDWAKEARRFLEACASVRQSLSQIALTFTTKGGQQAIEGLKAQFGTTVGPTSSLLDQNPPAVAGATFGSGPGTKLEAFKTSGAGFDPEGVRQYKLMCCMVKGVPETFLADVSTGNLATATSLDRPTETAMLSLQEEWVEDLAVIAKYVLETSSRAPSGRLKESAKKVKTIEMRRRVQRPDGRMVYEAYKAKPDTVQLHVNFPAIREGDIPTLVLATVQAMTLNRGTVTGIDAKAGVKKLFDLLGVEGGDELAEAMYPDGEYDPSRTLEPDPVEEPAQPDSAVLDEAARTLREALDAANLRA